MARAAAETRRGQVAGGVLGGWILTAACALCFLVVLHARVPQVDDAYISYRYAAQLVEGHGLVFNVGERVEGYTNLLWTLAVAAGLVLGWPAPAVGHALGLASGLAALLASYALARAGHAESGPAWRPDYVLSRRPDYILVARKDSPGKGNLPAVAGLWAHPDLERLYVWDTALEGYRLRDGGRWPREPGAAPR